MEVSGLMHSIRFKPVDLMELSEVNFGEAKFIDPYFSPDLFSIHGGDYFDLPQRISWKRPEEFINRPVVFNDEITPDDVRQGFLGNCWFLSAVAALAEHPEYLLNIFTNTEISKTGAYRLKLCKSGEWLKVTIDDLMPLNGEVPIFSKNNGREIWVLLLEKAYAKIHGSYGALAFGFSNEALIDLTGAPGFLYTFNALEDTLNSGEFSDWLQIWYMKNYCMIASTSEGVNRESTGLVPSHAYTVRKVSEYANETLINLRNPWGRQEWKGDWADESEKWTPEAKIALDYQELDDGTFWMNYYDFIVYFSNLYVGKVGFPFEFRSRVMITSLPGTGGIGSHCLLVEVERRGEVIIGLHQEDERSVGGELRQYLDIGIVVLLIQGENYTFVSSTEGNKISREQQLELELDPGTYLVVPISSGCEFSNYNFQNEETPFWTETGDLHPLFKSTIRDIYRRFDYDLSQTLSYEEFKEIMDSIGMESSREFYEEVILTTYTSSEGGMTLQGLYEFFMLETLDKGENDMRMWMRRLGYDKSFNSVDSRALVFTVHAENELQINSIVDDTLEYNYKAWLHLSENLAKCSDILNTRIYLIKHREGYTITAENLNERRVRIEIDLEGYNLVFSIETQQVRDEIEGGEFKIIEHAQIREKGEPWQFENIYRVSLS